jgi:hypothetical protein
MPPSEPSFVFEFELEGVLTRVCAEVYKDAHSRWSLANNPGEGWELGKGGPGETTLSYAERESSFRIARL